MNLDHLAQLATEATPGPWNMGHYSVDSRRDRTDVFKASDECPALIAEELIHEPDAAFIAAANPETVLALVEVCRAAQKVRPAAWRRLTAILHAEWPEQSARVAVFADALAKLDNLGGDR